MNAAWKMACILVCASVGGGLLLAVAAEWLAWRARPRRAMDEAITLVCRACVPGKAAMGQRCTCTLRCGHLDCIGDYTSTFPAIREDM